MRERNPEKIGQDARRQRERARRRREVRVQRARQREQRRQIARKFQSRAAQPWAKTGRGQQQRTRHQYWRRRP